MEALRRQLTDMQFQSPEGGKNYIPLQVSEPPFSIAAQANETHEQHCSHFEDNRDTLEVEKLLPQATQESLPDSSDTPYIGDLFRRNSGE